MGLWLVQMTLASLLFNLANGEVKGKVIGQLLLGI